MEFLKKYFRFGIVLAFSSCAVFGVDLVSVGVKGGFPLNYAFSANSLTVTMIGSVRTGDFNQIPGGSFLSVPVPIPNPFLTVPTPTSQTYRESKNFLIGPTIEVHLPLGLSVEADALYRPLDRIPSFRVVPAQGFQNFLVGSILVPVPGHEYASWEFPVMAKYRLPGSLVKPYLEAGPAFRALATPLSHYWSNAGAAAGVGVEASLLHLQFSPEVRFTHWGKDSVDAGPQGFSSEHNQAEVLIGASF